MDKLSGRVVVGHPHLQGSARVAKILGDERGSLLANEQSGRVGVAADVVGTDGKIGDLEALDAVNVQALVQNTVLDDAVALSGGHGTGLYPMSACVNLCEEPLYLLRGCARWSQRGA